MEFPNRRLCGAALPGIRRPVPGSTRPASGIRPPAPVIRGDQTEKICPVSTPSTERTTARAASATGVCGKPGKLEW